ncbi:hypothetical protein E5288_WYG005947 [Bos mutus]|uniref:Uncharacterized protein n=1 Tax=Bos mutus TaxID=72004 RepID=A0A6B0R082_9CETA|nr:hypothetical protein [Bos mutus]
MHPSRPLVAAGTLLSLQTQNILQAPSEGLIQTETLAQTLEKSDILYKGGKKKSYDNELMTFSQEALPPCAPHPASPAALCPKTHPAAQQAGVPREDKPGVQHSHTSPPRLRQAMHATEFGNNGCDDTANQ